MLLNDRALQPIRSGHRGLDGSASGGLIQVAWHEREFAFFFDWNLTDRCNGGLEWHIHAQQCPLALNTRLDVKTKTNSHHALQQMPQLDEA